MSLRSRRDFLALAGVTGATVIAGCLDDAGTDLEEFSYPPGFAPDGIDPDEALGPESPTATVDSVTHETRWEFTFTDWTKTTSLEGRFDAVDERFVRSIRSLNTLQRRLLLTTEYFDSAELIRRQKVEPGSVEYRYNAREHSMDMLDELRLLELRKLVMDVDVSVDEVERTDDTSFAIYRAESADFGRESRLHLLGESLGELQTASLELVVSGAGHLREITVDGEMATDGGDPVHFDARWNYTDYDRTSVTTPDWLEEVPALDRPEVTVEFDEAAGEAVVVDIQEIRHTDEVAVTVDDVGVFESTSTPRTVEIPASAYTDDAGQPRLISVFAANELRGPVPIDVYRPG